MMFFLIHIVSFRIILSMKGVMCMFGKRVSFAGMLFNVILNVIIF